MKTTIHKSDTRGIANHGWLNSRHTYSFSNYHNTNRMGFGKLRVINDDIIEASMGFGTHPHDNMEIISIPLQGSLRHEDSMGNKHIIETGEIQIMSAGTGLTHSEYNDSNVNSVNFLQIWITPKEIDIKPRYEQKHFNAENRHNKLQIIVSPDGEEKSISINQDVYFSLIDLDEEHSINYQLHNTNNGVYIFVIAGSVMLGDTLLDERDGIEVSESLMTNLMAREKTQLLYIETPI